MANLQEIISTKQNLITAWYSIKHRRTSRGLDGVTIAQFEYNLNRELSIIRRQIRDGTYKFGKLRAHPLPKGKGKIRPLRIPAVRDRVVQKSIELSIKQILYDRYKIENSVSFAYIKDQSVEKVVKRVHFLFQHGYKWIYIADIRKFFDSVDVGTLLDNYIFPCLPDTSINYLIEAALKAEIGNEEEMRKRGVFDQFPEAGSGIPQGGILSPLFSNVYLSPLDQRMIREELNMVRYADDFVVMCLSEQEAQRAEKIAREELEQLGLTLHPLATGHEAKDAKVSKIEQFGNQEFLGIRFRGDRMYPGRDTCKRAVVSLQQVRTKPDYDNLIENLNFLRRKTGGWGAAFHYTDYDKAIYETLDNHLLEALESLLARYDLVARGGKITPAVAQKIGIYTYTRCLNIHKEKQREKSSRPVAS